MGRNKGVNRVNTLQKTKIKLGWSYRVIGDRLGVQRVTAFSWITKPWRASKEVVTKVAELLGADVELVVEEWKQERIERYSEKL